MPTRISASENINSVQLKNQGSAPSSPASGFVQLYTKGSSLWVKHSDGSVAPISDLTPGGRLTLTSGTPVTTSDVLAATTLYYTPFKHNLICLFDGTADWIPMQFSELSLSLSGYTAAKPYDIFCYNNSGTAALESCIWTDGSTRATALAWQNGRLVKSGTTTRLYIGTIYMSATGQTEDSLVKRFVWNMYHRVERRLYKEDTTASWTFNSVYAYRQMRATSSNQVEWVCGVQENPLDVRVQELAFTVGVYPGFGINSTTVNSATTQWTQAGQVGHAFCKTYAPVGYSYGAMLEQSVNNNVTIYGVYATVPQTLLDGIIRG